MPVLPEKKAGRFGRGDRLHEKSSQVSQCLKAVENADDRVRVVVTVSPARHMDFSDAELIREAGGAWPLAGGTAAGRRS